MKLIDSHSHLFLEEFAEDLPQVMERARNAGVTHVFMPNIDSTTIEPMLRVCRDYEGYCYPMIGLHPTSVNADYEKELGVVAEALCAPNNYVAIGEIGMDLYWDKAFLKEQQVVLDKQIGWAQEYGLPVVIHCREAFDYIYNVLRPYQGTSLGGIFHSFTGTREEADVLVAEFPNFMVGINGVVTFKKSALPEVLKHIPLERIVLETDSPYLTPVPNRGKRNESAYVKDTLMKVAEVYGCSPEEVAQTTSANALKVFGMLE
ncbi:MAG: TatD family hydrolase [Bacteroides sp.]|nr:TatD family hydrolase [Bacteroides sp.]